MAKSTIAVFTFARGLVKVTLRSLKVNRNGGADITALRKLLESSADVTAVGIF
jgi:hypothetical protein